MKLLSKTEKLKLCQRIRHKISKFVKKFQICRKYQNLQENSKKF